MSPRRAFVAQLPVVDEALLAAELARDPVAAAAAPTLARYLRRSPGGVSVMRRLGALLAELPEEVREALRLERLAPPDLGQPRLTFRAAQYLVSAPQTDEQKRQLLTDLSDDRVSPAELVAQLREETRAVRRAEDGDPAGGALDAGAAQAKRLGLPANTRADVRDDGTVVFSYSLDPMRVRFDPDRELEDLMRFAARLLEIGTERVQAAARSGFRAPGRTPGDRDAAFERAAALTASAMAQRDRVLNRLAEYRGGSAHRAAGAPASDGSATHAAPSTRSDTDRASSPAASGAESPLLALPPIEVSPEEIEQDLGD